MKTNYPGIDYGLGRTNIGANGIRFGVIPANDVGQSWYDDAEPDYGEPTCPKCGGKLAQADCQTEQLENGVAIHYSHNAKRQGYKLNREHSSGEYACDGCGVLFDSDEVFPDSPNAFTYEADGYKAKQSGDDCDIFILESPFFTYAQFCSPCAPGACYLRSPLETPDPDNRAFCFGHDWFEDGVAPYPVYSVETGELIQPEAC